MYSYPPMNTAHVATEIQKGIPDFVCAEIATPVATTIAVAATSPHRMRLMLPSFASCSWKNGEDTVNHEGQNPAKTPDASPMIRGTKTKSSVFIRRPTAERPDQPACPWHRA